MTKVTDSESFIGGAPSGGEDIRRIGTTPRRLRNKGSAKKTQHPV